MVTKWLKAATDPDNPRVVLNVGARDSFAALFAEFKHWCGRTGREVPTTQAFSYAMTSHSFPAIRGVRGQKMRGGLRLNYWGTPENPRKV